MTTSSIGATLPLEVVDAITIHHRDDRETIRACSLVSPLWTVSARRHIFETVSFRIDDFGKRPPFKRTLRRFHKFLTSTEYVAGFIKRLELCCEDPEDEDVKYQVPITLLFSVLRKLTALNTLELDAVLWSRLPEDTASSELVCPSVKTFIIREIGGPSEDLDQVTCIFYMFPCLQNLRLIRWGLDILEEMDMVEPVEMCLPKDLRLRSLHVDDALTACFMESLARTQTPGSLESLAIVSTSTTHSDLQRIGTFLKVTGHTLRHLKLDISLCPVRDGRIEQGVLSVPLY